MKKIGFKALSVMLAMTMLFSLVQVSAAAANVTDYTITNPYKEVTSLLGNMDKHYKTNLHTHSTYSDAEIDLNAMVKGHYNQDFDVLAMAEHGIIGVEWNKAPNYHPLYAYNYALLNDQSHLSDTEFEQIVKGTYRTDLTTRENKRGMECVTGAIEANMLVAQKNHVNGYFCSNNIGNVEHFLGNEGDFETAVQKIEDCGGLSHINHPGDWLGSASDAVVLDEDGNPLLDVNGEPMTRGYQIATDPKNVEFFAKILRKHPSCLGIEVYNSYDRPTSGDRILWDSLLKASIPEGRNVWGFANNDAHYYEDIDTAFMDYVMPEYSMANLRNAMTKGHFFAVSRYESGDRIGNTKEYPQVTSILVEDKDGSDKITIISKNTDSIKWIADGKTIQETTVSSNGIVISTITLQEHSDDISCYVRAELQGEGGKTLTQAFVADDGNMEDLITRGPSATAPIDFITVLRSLLKMLIRTFTSIFQ